MSISIYAQNLIANPEFEVYEGCPNAISQLDSISDWFNAGNTPDFLDTCASGTNAGVPFSGIFGYQLPLSGGGYVGLYTYDVVQGNYREFIEAPFLEEVQAGDTLYFSFWLNRASGEALSNNDCSSNGFGFKLTNTIYSPPGLVPAIDNTADWHMEEILEDTVEWHLFSGQIVASDNFSHVVFGNFFDDNNTTTLYDSPWGCRAYYYLENVCFSKSGQSCELAPTSISEFNTRSPFVYPTQVEDIVSLNHFGKILEVRVVDYLGNIHYTIMNPIGNILNLSNLRPGYYVMLVETDEGLINTRIVKQ